MTRLEANNKLLNILSRTLSQYPDYRFGQALFNLGFVQRSRPGTVLDPFYEEPQHMLERMAEVIYEDKTKYECNFNVAVSRMLAGDKFTCSSGDPALIYHFDGKYFLATNNDTDLPIVLTPELLSAVFTKYNPPTNEEPTTTNSSN